MRRNLATATLVLFCLSTLNCGPKSATVPANPRSDLLAAAKALNGVLEACDAAVDGILIAMPQNSDDRKAALGVIKKIVEADTKARNVIRGLNDLDLGTKQNLSVLLAPAFQEFRSATESGLFGFKSEETRRKVQGVIDAISTSISILETVLAVRGS